MQHVLVRAVERLAGRIPHVQWINRILGQVGAEPDLGDDRAFKVVVAIDAHGVGIHRPTVDDARQGFHLPLHQALRLCGHGVERGFDFRCQRAHVERLAGLDPNALDLRQHRLICAVGRMHFEQFGGVGEVVSRRQ
ncbi:hypothetical protein D3C86_1667000 [compost metagenome]